MKNILRFLSLILVIVLSSASSFAQESLAPDQNPLYTQSRDKYLKLADSITGWHSTTFQETYKAIDWLEDRAEARQERREFRRSLRLERARWNNQYRGNYYYPYYRNRGNFYNYSNYRNQSFFGNPWSPIFWWR